MSNTIPHPTRRAYPHSSKGGNKVDPSQLLDKAQKRSGEKKSRFKTVFIDSFMAADGAIGASPETQSALLEEDPWDQGSSSRRLDLSEIFIDKKT